MHLQVVREPQRAHLVRLRAVSHLVWQREGASPLLPHYQALGHQLLDRLPDYRPGHLVLLLQLPLGGEQHGLVRVLQLLDLLAQDRLELVVVRDGAAAVQGRHGHRAPLPPPIGTDIVSLY